MEVAAVLHIQSEVVVVEAAVLLPFASLSMLVEVVVVKHTPYSPWDSLPIWIVHPMSNSCMDIACTAVAVAAAADIACTAVAAAVDTGTVGATFSIQDFHDSKGYHHIDKQVPAAAAVAEY